VRDKRFVAEHRGGPLQLEQHRQLMRWAHACAEHVLPLLGGDVDERLLTALSIARAWAEGKASTGAAMKASLEAHAAARAYSDPVAVAVARSVGQGVATAHMSDHSLGAALYALKAVNRGGRPVDEERKWQEERMRPEVKDLVHETMAAKEKHFRM
jgi:hypothetical protein